MCLIIPIHVFISTHALICVISFVIFFVIPVVHYFLYVRCVLLFPYSPHPCCVPWISNWFDSVHMCILLVSPLFPHSRIPFPSPFIVLLLLFHLVHYSLDVRSCIILHPNWFQLYSQFRFRWCVTPTSCHPQPLFIWIPVLFSFICILVSGLFDCAGRDGGTPPIPDGPAWTVADNKLQTETTQYSSITNRANVSTASRMRPYLKFVITFPNARPFKSCVLAGIRHTSSYTP